MSAQTTPTIHVRKQEICQFLETLDNWDRLYLRQRLRAQPLCFSSLHHLPAELIYLIADKLPVEDIINAASTCREWRAAVLQGDVMTSLTRANFPGFLESAISEKDRPHAIFFDACKSTVSQYYSSSNNVYTVQRWFIDSHHLSRPEQSPYLLSWPEQSTSAGSTASAGSSAAASRAGLQVRFGARRINTVYCNGRFAWQPDRSFFYFQDLRKFQSRREIGFGGYLISGRKCDLLTMSDHLVILSVMDSTRATTCRRLRVWHIELGEWKDISIASPLAQCHVSGLDLYITTLSGELFSWTWGGKLCSIPKTGLAFEPEGCILSMKVPGVIPHPSETNTLYVVWLYEYSGPKPKTSFDDIPNVEARYFERTGLNDTSSSYSYDDISDSDGTLHVEINSNRFTHWRHTGSDYSPSSSPPGSTHEASGPDSDDDEAFDGKLFTVVVIKYVGGRPTRRFASRMTNSGMPWASWRHAQNPRRCAIRFNMTCQRLDEHGGHLLGAVQSGQKTGEHQAVWSGLCFNVLAETFSHVRYYGARCRGEASSSWFSDESRKFSFSARNHHLLVHYDGISHGRAAPAPTLLDTEDMLPELLSGITTRARPTSSGSGSGSGKEPRESLGILKKLLYGQRASRVYVDDAGVFVATDKAFIFSANPNSPSYLPQAMEKVTYRVPPEQMPTTAPPYPTDLFSEGSNPNPFPNSEIILDCFNATRDTVSQMCPKKNLIPHHQNIYDQVRWNTSWETESSLHSLDAPRPPEFWRAEASIEAHADYAQDNIWPVWDDMWRVTTEI